jgi:glycosyltransferase involved in cell wall biosynthesis
VRLFGRNRARVAIVASVLARYDGISMAVRHTVQALRDTGGYHVSVFAPHSDFPELSVQRVDTAAALRAHRGFRSADLVIYHFGIFSPLFETMAQTGGGARRLIAFHNVTPPEFVAPTQRSVIEQSFRQMAAVRYVDRLWAESPTSVEALVAHGVSPTAIDIIPPAVSRPAVAGLTGKRARPVRLLFVGRLVKAKGVVDLIEAIDLARTRARGPFTLHIAGNEDFSDPAYVAEAKTAVLERGLSTCVRFLGAIGDDALEAEYQAAQILVIPSYHEGFCRPVIEGLRAGCVPVGYAAFNLPHVARGLGRMVPVGDRRALAAALAELIDALTANDGRAHAPLPLDAGSLSVANFDSIAQAYVQDFSVERVAALKLRSIQALLSG